MGRIPDSRLFCCYGDYNGHVGLGIKCSKEVATAFQRVITLAKPPLSLCEDAALGNKIVEHYSVPSKVPGHWGSVFVHLIPDPRGTGDVSAPELRKFLMMGGIHGCYASAKDSIDTLHNFSKATFEVISNIYRYLILNLPTVFTKSPYQDFTRHLVKPTPKSVQRTQAPAVAST